MDSESGLSHEFESPPQRGVVDSESGSSHEFESPLSSREISSRSKSVSHLVFVILCWSATV